MANGDAGDMASVSVRAGHGTNNRRARNKARIEQLKKDGYNVEEGKHPNGAFFAYKGKGHQPHELEAGRICAENGLSFTLDPEGNAFVRLPNRTRIMLSSLDGTIEGFTHEIMALNATNLKPEKVAEGIEHSFKPTKHTQHFLQAFVAITITPQGSNYNKKDIDDGVKLYKERYLTGKTIAKPRIYLHIDTDTRKVWYRRLV